MIDAKLVCLGGASSSKGVSSSCARELRAPHSFRAWVKHFPVVNSVIALGWEVTQVRTWWDSEVRGSEGSEVRSEGSAFDFRFKVISGVPASH